MSGHTDTSWKLSCDDADVLHVIGVGQATGRFLGLVAALALVHALSLVLTHPDVKSFWMPEEKKDREMFTLLVVGTKLIRSLNLA